MTEQIEQLQEGVCSRRYETQPLISSSSAGQEGGAPFPSCFSPGMTEMVLSARSTLNVLKADTLPRSTNSVTYLQQAGRQKHKNRHTQKDVTTWSNKPTRRDNQRDGDPGRDRKSCGASTAAGGRRNQTEKLHTVQTGEIFTTVSSSGSQKEIFTAEVI